MTISHPIPIPGAEQMSANPNLLSVSEAAPIHRDPAYRKACAAVARGILTGLPSNDLARLECWANAEFWAGYLAAEQAATAAFIAMLEGMKRPSLWADSPTRDRNAVIDEAIANAKALGEGRAAS